MTQLKWLVTRLRLSKDVRDSSHDLQRRWLVPWPRLFLHPFLPFLLSFSLQTHLISHPSLSCSPPFYFPSLLFCLSDSIFVLSHRNILFYLFLLSLHLFPLLCLFLLQLYYIINSHHFLHYDGWMDIFILILKQSRCTSSSPPLSAGPVWPLATHTASGFGPGVVPTWRQASSTCHFLFFTHSRFNSFSLFPLSRHQSDS